MVVSILERQNDPDINDLLMMFSENYKEKTNWLYSGLDNVTVD